jgi:hypothetical protein
MPVNKLVRLFMWLELYTLVACADDEARSNSDAYLVTIH